MSNVKQETIKLIEALDDNCSVEDIHYHLYVKQKIERGLKALEEGRHLTHGQVKEKLSKWLKE